MFLLPSQSTQLARLFSLLSQGELLAHHSATQQYWLMNTTGNVSHAKFFKRQSQQEHFHSRIFDAAVLWLGDSKIQTQCKSLDHYASQIQIALAKGALAESVLATQVILESVGKMVLEGIDGRMQQQNYGLKKIRDTILAQEAEHHEFGQSQLLAIMRKTGASRNTMQHLTQKYLELANNMFDEMDPLFDSLDSDISHYKHRLNKEIPHWLRAN